MQILKSIAQSAVALILASIATDLVRERRGAKRAKNAVRELQDGLRTCRCAGHSCPRCAKTIEQLRKLLDDLEQPPLLIDATPVMDDAESAGEA
ncbi:MAG: hypothetical protein ABIG71_01880 [Candidatus Uhrbacteria bacterium]